MEFIETTVFSRFLLEHLTDTEFSEFQQKLVENPKLGDKIPGSGGLRKVRWESSKHGTGKRGGLRIIYFHHVTDNQIYLLTLYWKGDVKDLTKNEIRILNRLLEGWSHGKA